MWKLYAAGGVAVVIALLSVALRFEHMRAERLELALDRAIASARAWEASFRKSERLRVEEVEQARKAQDEQAKACDVRVAKARKSAAAIRSIITKEPTYDAAHCPLRLLVSPDLLRDAITPG